MKKNITIISILLIATLNLKSQTSETRYAIETTFDGKTPVTFEEMFGALNLNSNTGELTFTTNLAKLKTGNKTIDSLLNEQELLPFTFQGSIGQDLFAIIKDQNDDTFHKVVGTVTVNNINYPSIAQVKIENISNKSDVSKTFLDFLLEIDPKLVKLPYLSDYFNSILIFQIENGVLNKLK